MTPDPGPRLGQICGLIFRCGKASCMAPARMMTVGREERRERERLVVGFSWRRGRCRGAGRGLAVGAPDGIGACGGVVLD